MMMDAVPIAAGLLGLLGVIAILNGVRELARARGTRSWPRVRGVVLSSGAKTTPSLGRAWYPSPGIRFEYAVEGRKYTSEAYSASAQSVFFTQRAVSQIVERYRPGAEIDVYFDPSDPAVGILEPGYRPVASNGRFILIGLLALYFAGRLLLH
jgi:hypothetical protein